jgi:hypothetical protein
LRCADYDPWTKKKSASPVEPDVPASVPRRKKGVSFTGTSVATGSLIEQATLGGGERANISINVGAGSNNSTCTYNINCFVAPNISLAASVPNLVLTQIMAATMRKVLFVQKLGMQNLKTMYRFQRKGILVMFDLQ